MKFYFLSICFLLSINALQAQVISGIVVDDHNNAVPNAVIKDTTENTVVTSDRTGRFELSVTKQSILEVSYLGYETIFLKATETIDTIRLFPKDRLLKPIDVSSSKILAVIDVQNWNIIDYLLIKDYLFVLCSVKSKKHLLVQKDAKIIRDFELTDINAKSLFEDCFGNIHILTKEKAIQISIDDDIHVVQEASINEFNKILKPCVALIEDYFFVSLFSDHNQKYILANKRTDQINYTPILTIFDEKSASAAKALYYEIIYEYRFKYSDTVSDIILNGFWDGNMKDLAINYHLMTKVGFYEGVLAKELTVQSFKHGNQVITFDMVFDSIYIHDQMGVEQSRKYFDLGSKNKSKETILYDRVNQQFYMLSNRNEIYSIALLDISESSTEKPTTIEIPFIENVKIHNNWIYFLINREGFRKLYRQKY